MTKEQRAGRKAAQQAQNDRIREAHARVAAIVSTGRCPDCGAGLRRNLSLTGWWQCEQFGAVSFRKDQTRSECHWQGFTES